MDPGETPAAAAERELLEETISTATVPSYNTEFGHRFPCTGAELTQAPTPGQFEDVCTVEVTADEIASFIASGAIICQSTILSALFAVAYLQLTDLIAGALGQQHWVPNDCVEGQIIRVSSRPGQPLFPNNRNMPIVLDHGKMVI